MTDTELGCGLLLQDIKMINPPLTPKHQLILDKITTVRVTRILLSSPMNVMAISVLIAHYFQITLEQRT